MIGYWQVVSWRWWDLHFFQPPSTLEPWLRRQNSVVTVTGFKCALQSPSIDNEREVNGMERKGGRGEQVRLYFSQPLAFKTVQPLPFCVHLSVEYTWTKISPLKNILKISVLYYIFSTTQSPGCQKGSPRIMGRWSCFQDSLLQPLSLGMNKLIMLQVAVLDVRLSILHKAVYKLNLTLHYLRS